MATTISSTNSSAVAVINSAPGSTPSPDTNPLSKRIAAGSLDPKFGMRLPTIVGK